MEAKVSERIEGLVPVRMDKVGRSLTKLRVVEELNFLLTKKAVGVERNFSENGKEKTLIMQSKLN